MLIRTATRADHDAIVSVVPAWWGGRDLRALVQPLFLAHFASSSLVAEDDDGALAGFLVGFPSDDDETAAYVHFIGVRPDRRGTGLGRLLHERFADAMRARGVAVVRCVTSPVNVDSVAFHERLGFTVESVDDDYVHLARRIGDGRFAPRRDARPDDVPWPDASWPVPGDTVLEHGDVDLRPSSTADADELFAVLDDDRVWTHVRGRPGTAAAMAESLAAAEDNGRYPWTVRQGGRVVGTTSFLEVSPVDARLEIGFTLYAPAVWGTHVNPSCKLLLMRWAFDHGFGRVQLKTDIRNARSQQAIARLGATYEGVLRRYQRRQDGSVRDTVVFSVTAEEWPDVRSGLLARLLEPPTVAR